VIDAEAPMATEQTWFIFSFHEHGSFMIDRYAADSSPEQAFIQMIASEEWVRGRTGVSGEFEGHCAAGIGTLEAFEAHVREILTDEYGFTTVELRYLDFPFARLRATMEAGGWQFVGGDFTAMEGNHNDTEISVLVERNSR
jgi:hypothetical protein